MYFVTEGALGRALDADIMIWKYMWDSDAVDERW